MVGVRLGHARGHRADPDLGDELDRDARARVGAAQVVDQLLEVLDRVDVVVRRRRDQADAGRRGADLADVAVDLVARELAALARLGALRHLDLDLVGVREVVDRHAEAARGHLLDRGAARVAVGVGDVARRVLPALAGVRLAADPVHGDRERLVRLARQRAERHRAGGEALDDLARGLDVVERDAAVSGNLKPISPRSDARRAERRVHLGRPLVVARPAAVADRVLELGDRLRVPHVVLAVPAPRVDAADRQQLAGLGIRAQVARERLAPDHVEPDAADPRRGAGEVAVDQPGLQADGLEDLRPVVGLDRRDAHLRERLEQPLADRLDDVALALLAARRARRRPRATPASGTG